MPSDIMFFSSTFLLVPLMSLWIHPSVGKIFTFSKATSIAVHVIIMCVPFVSFRIACFEFYIYCSARIVVFRERFLIVAVFVRERVACGAFKDAP